MILCPNLRIVDVICPSTKVVTGQDERGEMSKKQYAEHVICQEMNTDCDAISSTERISALINLVVAFEECGRDDYSVTTTVLNAQYDLEDEKGCEGCEDCEGEEEEQDYWYAHKEIGHVYKSVSFTSPWLRSFCIVGLRLTRI